MTETTPSTPDRWDVMFHDLAVFLLAHDRLPSRTSSGQEKRLYTWLAMQKHPYENRTRPKPKRDLLDLLGIPQTGWLEGERVRAADAEWFAMLEQVTAFAAEHERRPGVGKSRPEHEQRLHAWLSRNMRYVTEDRLLPHRHEALVASGVMDLPKGRSPFLHEPWMARLAEVVAFVEQHGTRPSHASDDPHTYTLGLWLNRQRARITQGTLPRDLGALLDEASARTGVDLTARIDSTSRREAPARVAEFLRVHGRLPRGTEPDALWLAQARVQYHRGDLNGPMREALDAIDPNWSVSPAPRSGGVEDTADAVAKFVAEHGRLPRGRKGGETETRLAQRLSTYRWAHRRGRLNKDQIAVLDDRVPGWMDTKIGRPPTTRPTA